jgi:regulation of enolase protein 1 (concanavalin A-like superfamily)
MTTVAMILLQIFAPFFLTAPAASTYSDEFSGSSVDAKWTEYDPPNNVTLSVGSGVLTVAIPSGSSHDWYTGDDNALRLRQTYTGSTNFTIEARFNTTMASTYQFQGLTVDADNSNGFRVDFNYNDGATQYIHAATFSAGTYTQELFVTSSVTSQPYYLRVAKSGTTYTVTYSANGSSWTSAGSFTWSGTVAHIGLIIGTAPGASSPAFTTTVDSFTYTAQ